jgi:hypothetical protein
LGAAAGVSFNCDDLPRLTDTKPTFNTSTAYCVQPVYDLVDDLVDVIATLPQGSGTQVFCDDD